MEKGRFSGANWIFWIRFAAPPMPRPRPRFANCGGGEWRSLLEELFHDLGRRATEIAEELRNCASTVPAEVEAYRAKMELRATRASALTAMILRDPDLNAPLFAQNFYRDFRDIARLVQALEHLPLLVLAAV